MIPLHIPCLNEKEILSVSKCLKSGWISTSGKFVNEFENNLKNYVNSKYSVACINATSALDICLKVLGVNEKHEVIAPTITFISPINAIRYNRASPIFMDCDEFFNIDENKVIEFLENETIFKKNNTWNKKSKKIIKAIIVVHTWGNAAKLENLISICKKKNIKVIEDASESLGTYYKTGKLKHKYTGTIGDIGCISFNANKIISTGGGGMILTNNKKLFQKALYLTTQAKDDPVRYIHNDIGYNYRMTAVHAAIGIIQLKKLEKFIKNKEKIYNHYKNHFKNNQNIKLFETPKYAHNNFWLIIIQVKSIKNLKLSNKFVKYMNLNNIEVRPIWYLNHLQNKFRNFQNYKIKNSIKFMNNCFCIPSGPDLTTSKINKVANSIKKF